MKRKSAFKSMFTLALSLALMLSLILTVSAEGSTITINGDGQASLGGAERFTAYQIFKGNLGSADKPEELVGIEWGSGVNSDNLVAALKESTLAVEGGTLGGKFSEAYESWEDKQKETVDEAEFVAQFLSAHRTNLTYADDFARIVAEHTTGVGIKSVSREGGWQIDVGDNGYYLVKDNYTTASESGKPDASVSSYILEVLGERTVGIKSSIPTVTKKVEGQDGFLAEENQTVNFILTGTVAQNIGEYKTYSYTFTDTLSKGLTVDESLTDLAVRIVNGEAGHTTEYTFDKAAYTANVTAGEDGGHILTVTFGDLLAAAKDHATIDKNSRIVVTYTAKLNDSAVVGDAGNPNTVTLKYSNNPYDEGTGESVPDMVKTYTLGLDVVKKGEEGKNLPGVKFKLKNTTDNKYAVLTEKKDSDDKTEYYAITGWADTEKEGTALVTDADGKFNIHGFSTGTYTLVETEALDDYEKMKDIVFDIGGGTIDESTGALNSVTWALNTADATRTDAEFTGGTTGTATLTITNYKAPILPNTGGIGAKIVYVVSGLAVLIGVCIVLAALRKRKDDKS